MKLAIFTALLVGLTTAAPTLNTDLLIINDELFIDQLKIYEGQHDIVKIYVPLNSINFEEDSSSSEESTQSNVNLFFVEADVKDGVVTDQGLYIRKKGEVKKLLDNGRDVDAPKDDSTIAFFAAKEGLYKYNSNENKAEKYGNIDNELKSVAVGNTSDHIFVLTANKEVFKVTDDGNKQVKADEINNAEQIIMDLKNNLFFLDSSKKLFVVNEAGIKEITGLPNAEKITLVKPPFVFEDGGIPLVVDNNVYSAFANGTVTQADIKIDSTSPITAYSVEATLLQYYARDKKIYEYNLLVILLGDLLKELQDFLENVKENIQSVATRSRKTFVSSSR